MAFGAFQFLALPTVIAKDATGWRFHLETLEALIFSFGCAWLVFRRLPIGVLLLGLVGSLRLFNLAAFVVRIVTGHATEAEGPATFLVLAWTSPVSVVWVVGAVWTLRGGYASAATLPPST